MERGEVWKLLADCPQADQVYLVKDQLGANSTWLTMQPLGDGRWELEVHLTPGRYRFRYYAMEGRTFFNCGSAALSAFHVRGNDPEVAVERLAPTVLAPSA